MESPIIAQLPRGHRMDRQFGIIYDRQPAQSDDLTQIDGIRTRESVLLNQLGIYCFGQVALWRHREVVAIAGELQVPVSRIIDEGWSEQGKQLCRPEPAAAGSLPASILRTCLLLACALLIGFSTVYLLGRHRNEPLTGVLSADITSIRVPADAHLTEVHAKPGDEVFSGQPLLTLEKVEHLELIENQEKLVRDLQREMKRLEAQAAIEVEWRTRDVERELLRLRQQVAQRETDCQTAALNRSAKSAVSETSVESSDATNSSGIPVSTVSSRSSRGVPVTTTSRKPRTNGLVFFAGSSGQSSPAIPASRPLPSRDEVPMPVAELQPTPAAEPVRVALAPEPSVTDSPAPLAVDPMIDSLRSEQTRLEAVKASLPATVGEALGMTALKTHLEDQTTTLEKMKSVSRDVVVESPVYGVVGQVRFRKGDDLPAGEIMLRILHTDRRYIVVHLPTRRVHEMEPGHEVELLFPGNEAYRGQVVDKAMVADSTAENGETLAAVRIEPVGRVWPTVPVGSQVDVISVRE